MKDHNFKTETKSWN